MRQAIHFLSVLAFLFLQLNAMRKLFPAFFTLLVAFHLSAQKTLIWCGTLIDGISEERLGRHRDAQRLR
jgi:hypothetical protein